MRIDLAIAAPFFIKKGCDSAPKEIEDEHSLGSTVRRDDGRALLKKEDSEQAQKNNHQITGPTLHKCSRLTSGRSQLGLIWLFLCLPKKPLSHPQWKGDQL